MDKLEQPEEKAIIPKLSSEDLNKYCNITIAKDLKTKINSMEEFIKWKKSLKSCFHWKNTAYWYLLPSIFCSFKDIYLNEHTWKLILNEDLDWIDIEKIKVIQAPNNLSKQNLFKEIRDAIEHKRMYPRRGKLFIRNPQNNTNHKYDFEAEIPNHVLVDFILTTTLNKRGTPSYKYKYNDKDLPNDIILDYEKEKENIKFYECKTTEKGTPTIPVDQKSYIEYLKTMFYNVERKEIELTKNQEDMLSEYFKKNKCRSGNLTYVSKRLLRHDIVDRDMQSRITILENKKFEKYTLNDFLKDNEVRERAIFWHWDPTKLFENETLLQLWEKLRTSYQQNWHHILEHYHWCIKLCHDFLKNKWYSINYNEYIFKNWNKTITFDEIWLLIDLLMTENININNWILEIPNRLRVQMLKTIYINGLITWPDSEEDRHIRNSLTHNNYTIFQWVDKIILRDGYNKKSNRYNREKIYDLKSFSDSKYQEMLYQNNINNDTESQINAEIFFTLATKEEKENLIII